jgi:hypothetical protein
MRRGWGEEEEGERDEKKEGGGAGPESVTRPSQNVSHVHTPHCSLR